MEGFFQTHLQRLWRSHCGQALENKDSTLSGISDQAVNIAPHLNELGEHDTGPLADTQRVVNPAWRQLDKQRRTWQSKLTTRRAKFAALTLHPASEADPARFRTWVATKADLLEEIGQYEEQLERIKAALQETPHHLRCDQLPEEEPFHRFAPTRRRLLDTIRMIAYRAETAMVPWLLDEHTDSPAARTLLLDLFRSAADIVPEPEHQRLRVCVHHSARPVTDRSLRRLFAVRNEADLVYPGTDLILRYELLADSAAPPENGVT